MEIQCFDEQEQAFETKIEKVYFECDKSVRNLYFFATMQVHANLKKYLGIFVCDYALDSKDTNLS